MIICIEHLKVKRLINGSGFNISGSVKDLRFIADQILNELSKSNVEADMHIAIRIREPNMDEHTSNSVRSALSWTQNNNEHTN